MSELTQDSFDARVAAISAKPDTPTTLSDEMAALLLEAIQAQGDWIIPALVGLVRGDHGRDATEYAVMAIEDGFAISGQRSSFARQCILERKIPLIAEVAELGFPSKFIDSEKLRRVNGSPGTPIGDWLDVMSNTCTSRLASFQGTNFCRQVMAFSGSPAVAEALADIQVRHDPGHAVIETLKGQDGYQFFTAALMRKEIARSVDLPPEAGSVPRRLQRVL